MQPADAGNAGCARPQVVKNQVLALQRQIAKARLKEEEGKFCFDLVWPSFYGLSLASGYYLDWSAPHQF